MAAAVGKALADVQTWDAAGYARNARFVSDLAGEVMAWLDPKPGMRVLDVGCGDGVLTEKLAALGCSVVGIDPSPSMIEAARARGLDVRLADVRSMAFEGEFDAVFSNAVLHWVREPEAAAHSMRKALKPGGKLAAEFGGHGNIAAIATALRAAAKLHGGDPALTAPWFYPTPEQYSRILTSAGFKVDRIGLFPRPTPLATAMEGWLATMRKPFFDQFPADKRAEVLADTLALLRPSLCDDQGNWTADYVRLRVLADAV